jgi:ceramide glucosyltransferase
LIDIVTALLLFLVIASWAYWLIAGWWVHTHFRTHSAHNPDFAPPISILKPIKGLDAEAYQNLASFCRQDYPEFEIIFAVSDPADPAIPAIERLQQDFPECSIRLLVAPDTLVNRKVSLLHAMEAQARYPVLAVSDSDMRVTPDYLWRVSAPLADPTIGLITCLYRGEDPHTLTARLEALYIGVTYLPSVLVGRRFLSMRFALGASITLRREDLKRIGGFASVGDYLADDYQLGEHIADLGLRVELSDYIVADVLGPTTFREQWNREVRWAQCTRVSRPLEYPGLILTFSTPLAIGLALVSGLGPLGLGPLLVSLLLRWAVAWQVTAETGNRALRRWFFWLPLRDMLSALVWCVGLVGRHVTWRGETFVLHSNGRLEPLPSAEERAARPGPLRRAILFMDRIMRRRLHIYEYSQDDGCLLRLAIRPNDREVTLADGTHVHEGAPVGELHLWNEHLPPMPEDGPNLRWGLAFGRQMKQSLADLAAHLESDPSLEEVPALRGVASFGSPYEMGHWTAMLEHWGFELVYGPGPDGTWSRLATWAEDQYAKGIAWAFNPPGARDLRLAATRRDQIWMSRQTLVSRYLINKQGPKYT